MINRSIFLSCFFIIAAPSSLQGSAPAVIPQKKYVNLKKQEIIKKLEFYWSFGLLLGFLQPGHELSVLIQLCRKKEGVVEKEISDALASLRNEEIPLEKRLDTDYVIHRLRALYCQANSNDTIQKIKFFGKKIIMSVHPDKHSQLFQKNLDMCSPEEIAFKEKLNTISQRTTDYLLNNIDSDGHINSLCEEIHELIPYAENLIYNNNYWKIEAYKLIQNSAAQVGYSIGAKVIDKIMPLSDPETEKVLRGAFVNKARVNTLNAEYILTDYLPPLHSRTKHVA